MHAAFKREMKHPFTKGGTDDHQEGPQKGKVLIETDVPALDMVEVVLSWRLAGVSSRSERWSRMDCKNTQMTSRTLHICTEDAPARVEMNH